MSEALTNGRSRIIVAGLTDVGRQRKHNEDTVLVRAELGLFAVADGMGGHNAGDVASKMVAGSLGAFFEATEGGGAPFDLPEEYGHLPAGGQRIAAGVRKANHDVFTVSNTNHAHHGMGSTCVAMHLHDEVAYIAHVGDSRCYRIRNGEILQLTRDHSLINDAIDMKPDLTREELARLPKNIITRALGMKDGVKVDVRVEQTEPGDIFLLCSDGLTGMVPPEQILEVVGLTGEPQEACELLIAEANDAGGTDNISALLVRIDDARAQAESAPALELVADADDDDEPLEEVIADDELDLDPAHFSEADEELHAPARPDGDPPPMTGPPVAVAPVVSLQPDPALEPAAPVVLTKKETRAAMLGGRDVDLDLRGPWTAEADDVPRCTKCNFEIFAGNSFCVECGAPIEEPLEEPAE